VLLKQISTVFPNHQQRIDNASAREGYMKRWLPFGIGNYVFTMKLWWAQCPVWHPTDTIWLQIFTQSEKGRLRTTVKD